VAVQAPFTRDAVSARGIETNPDVELLGTSPEGFSARNWIVERGRAIMASDIDSARAVCVLGSSVAKKLFANSSGLNERIKFRGINYTVVGVLESRGQTFGGDQDNFVVIPISTGLNRFGAQWRSLSLLVQAPNQESFEDTIELARGALRAIRKVPPQDADDFELFTNASLIDQFRSITFAARVGAGVISSIALLAAGIGIMNIMLVSVTERTREIGIRRAVGAKRRNIRTQFILEAIVVCEVGGLAGVLLGLAGGNATAWFMKVPPAIPFDWVALGLLICSIVGVVFGSYPAFKAANIDPIDALRYE
jgi:putative ABC transport system permease protein